MRLLTGFLCAALVLIQSGLAVAQDSAESDWITFEVYELGRASPWSIDLFDQVTDGCMPFPDPIREVAELRMRSANIDVNDVSLRRILISPLGYATNEHCTIYVSVEALGIGVMGEPSVPTFVEPVAAVGVAYRGMMLTGPKEGMQTRIRDAVAEMTDAIALEILKARDEVERLTIESANIPQ